MTQELEMELQRANALRTRTEKIVEDYRVGLGSEQQKTSLLLTELQVYLHESQETHAFEQLLNVVDALKISVDSQSKIEQIFASQLTVDDLSELSSLLQNINNILSKVADDISRIKLSKSLNADLERQVLTLIKNELEK